MIKDNGFFNWAILFIILGILMSCVSRQFIIKDAININDGFPASYIDPFIGLELILLPSGEFKMGSSENEFGRDKDEGPEHTIQMDSFYMGKYEITQGQWEMIMGKNPSQFKGNKNLPVEYISWEDVQEFIERLNKKTAQHYRLPTEAEWEYACRAGSKTAFYSGNDESSLNEFAWYINNSGRTTHPAGTKKPNSWGIYDMHGNVSEWVADGRREYTSEPQQNPKGPDSPYKGIHRGGCWLYPAKLCRSANRIIADKDFRTHIIGFRLAKDK